MGAILIGNGINRLENNKFDSKSIAYRFERVIKKNENLLSKMFITNEESVDFYKKSECEQEDNIERLLGKVYNYIKRRRTKFTVNDRYRLIEILSSISIESIFIQNNKIYMPQIPSKFINLLKKYDEVFSLNYYDNINIQKDINHLHGSINIKKIKTSRELMICSEFLYKYNSEYRKIIDEEYIKYKKIFIDARNIILMPEILNYTKQNHFGDGLYPDDNLYPADDLFPSSGMGDLYIKLNNIEALDIFGMSPFGDEDLIKKIQQTKNVTIYVYDLKNSSETEEWIKRVGNAKLKDSREFFYK